MRAAYDETQRIVQEQAYASMNERRWAEEQGQMLDIWVWWQRVKEILQNGPKRKDR